jgi:putative multiple sugar transport system substrate-binding protein
MVKALNEMGYRTDLQFADDDIATQRAQIENMISKGANVLVITAIDGTTLTDVLQKAKDADVLVIAYDHLISNTSNVDYFVTFDNLQVGVLQASQIEKALGLKDGKGPFNIELFGGSPDDANAIDYYEGAMYVLKPYIDNGTLVVQSGQISMDKVSTLQWKGDVAQARMDNLLRDYYTDKHLDAVLSPHDELSRAIISSLASIGYGSASQPWPIVTGQGAEIASIKLMIAHQQTFTIFSDTKEMARQTAKMINATLQGLEIPINDVKTHNNGVKIIPSYDLPPTSVDISNFQKILVDSGYINADLLK